MTAVVELEPDDRLADGLLALLRLLYVELNPEHRVTARARVDAIAERYAK